MVCFCSLTHNVGSNCRKKSILINTGVELAILRKPIGAILIGILSLGPYR
jgi:hypothetical protein